MSRYEIKMPKLGESVQEALITKWFVAVGDMVEEDQVLFEVATDKVDSEIPSPVDGRIIEIKYGENATAAVGETLAIIDMSGKENVVTESKKEPKESPKEPEKNEPSVKQEPKSNRFLSPLVKTIAEKEGISNTVLDSIKGSGENGRIRKQDILSYLETQKQEIQKSKSKTGNVTPTAKKSENIPPSLSAGDEIIEMNRMRKIIAQHMVDSVHTAPHVTSFVEADVENLVRWRNRVKNDFLQREKVNITYMPLFIEAVAKALRDFPLINVSLQDETLIKRGQINVGVAVSTDQGDLIVPVIQNADRKNLTGLTHELTDLAQRGRINKLTLDEIQGGTFTITNFGSFGNIMGTPIINQPQSAILATGTIEKKPAVLETEYGDVVVVRHKMFLSLSYDHRVIDGALGGAFLKRIAENLESFDTNREI
ncbi:MAG: dihydrolipoamide acetyltransferase family protein [Salinivirgaceae bacterium]|nr:dihydrolipoamide acetyltransferase family protein [Salinivirgaceae bacterium]MDY0279477.1 dihydrolipoamide acetyltransferase family protein [Salinivirgaceae bacterium]